MMLRNYKNVILLLFVFCATFLNAQKLSKAISYVIVKETQWTNELSKKENISGIHINLTGGFDKAEDIRIYLNRTLLTKCNRCETNESVDFVMEKNSESKYFNYFLDFKNVKKGDKIIIEYDGEIAVYRISSDLYKYNKLNINRVNKLNWEFSLVNDTSIRYYE
jgi:hypothetical protein